jgi:hypothetical protein
MPSLVLLRFPPLGETDGTQVDLVTFLGGAFDSDGGGDIDGACARRGSRGSGRWCGGLACVQAEGRFGSDAEGVGQTTREAGKGVWLTKVAGVFDTYREDHKRFSIQNPGVRLNHNDD